MAITDDELPVLSDIIRSGNESVIRSSRFEFSSTQPVNKEQNETPHSRNLVNPDTGKRKRSSASKANANKDHSITHTHFSAQSAGNDPVKKPENKSVSPHCESELENKIDQIVDKHMAALRKELGILLNKPL